MKLLPLANFVDSATGLSSVLYVVVILTNELQWDLDTSRDLLHKSASGDPLFSFPQENLSPFMKPEIVNLAIIPSALLVRYSSADELWIMVDTIKALWQRVLGK